VLLVLTGGCTGHVGEGGGPAANDPLGRPGQGGPASPGAPATGPRLTDRQYLNVVADLFGVDVSADAIGMPLDPKLEGFRNAASSLLPSDIRIEGYATLAQAVTAKIDWGQQLARLGVCADPVDRCRRDLLTVMGRRLFRRPLTDEQRARFSTVFDAVAKDGDPFPVAASLVVEAMLQSPEFLYRLERGLGDVDDFELATRLAFLLWNSAPDDPLLDAANRSGLSAPSALHAQVSRMLADPRAHRALRDYVDDWLDVDKLLRTSRDPSLFPQFTGALAADMREEIHRLFERVVWQDDADLVDVLRAERTVVTPALAALYGLPAQPGGFVEQDLSQVPARSGLLTQAGILTLTSVGGPGSSIVDRGVFVLGKLLCRTTPEPPSNVPELPPADSGKSERDRLAQHRVDPACGACHSQFDPLGVAFEAYDAIGTLRTRDEAGNRLTGAGSLTVGGQEVPFTNIHEFVAALTRSSDVGACLARKVVQYALARPLRDDDAPVVTDLSARFAAGGHRYQGLLGALAEGPWMRRAGVSP
jgi:hypothetical protein